MLRRKAYKYRVYPNNKQREKLHWTLDRTRELYNAALQERRDAYEYENEANYEINTSATR